MPCGLAGMNEGGIASPDALRGRGKSDAIRVARPQATALSRTLPVLSELCARHFRSLSGQTPCLERDGESSLQETILTDSSTDGTDEETVMHDHIRLPIRAISAIRGSPSFGCGPRGCATPSP